jgi:hypothetical protein
MSPEQLLPSYPVIFVANSPGGLVCKKAINNPKTHLRDIFGCIKGTPHKESWMADSASIPASAVALVKPVNKSLRETLE